MIRSQTTAVLLAASLVSACSTTEPLIPLVDVGDAGSSHASSPVTQGEAEQIARARPPIRGTDLAPPTQPELAYSEPGPERRGPGPQPSSLAAQAEAVDRTGLSPSASPPDPEALDPAMPEQPAETAETPGESTPEDTAMTETQPAVVPPSDAASDSAARTPPSRQASATLRFLPIIGAPVEAVTPLSRQLGADARAGGLTIKSASDTSADYILKGYLSAYSDRGKVTVNYVWDVLDGQGGRLHRIQGEERVDGNSGDPWADVPAGLMQSIASKTMAEFAAWRQQRQG